MNTVQQVSVLSATVRYRLARAKGTQIARVLDALFRLGCTPYQVLTEQELVTAVRPFNIGKKTVRYVVGATIPWTGKPVFQQVDPMHIITDDDGRRIYIPELPVISYMYTDIEISTSGKNGGRNPGRPPILYLIPDTRMWLPDDDLENVDCTITEHDLRSTTAYRQALLRNYTGMHSGIQQTRNKRGAVVGISARTSRTYDKKLGTIVIETVIRDEVTKDNFDEVMKSEPLYGEYLEVEALEGTRHCMVDRETAEYFIRENIPVYRCRLTANHYFASQDSEGITLQEAGTPIKITHWAEARQ